MRIALINGSAVPTPPWTYGSEIFTGQLAAQLVAHGHAVHLFAPGGSVAPTGVHLHYTPQGQGQIVPGLDQYVVQVYRTILMQCDVIHDLSGSVSVIESLAGTPHVPPMLYTRNGIDFNRPRWHRQNAVVLSHAARTCAINGMSAWHDTEPDYVQWDHPPGTLPNPQVVPYGTNSQFYHPAENETERLEKTAIYVGRPHPSKGIDHILELAQARPDWQFVLAWRPLFADHRHWDTYYHRQVETQGLRNVLFYQLPEVHHHVFKRGLYQRATCFIQPTRYIEAFGLTAIEAMMCGTPVMLSDHGSGPEIVEQGISGVTLSTHPFVVSQWADALDGMSRLDRSGIRERAVDRWDIEVPTQAYLRLYERLQNGETW